MTTAVISSGSKLFFTFKCIVYREAGGSLHYLRVCEIFTPVCDSTTYVHASKFLFSLLAEMTIYFKFDPFYPFLTPFPAAVRLFCITGSSCTGGISISAAAIIYSLSICCLVPVKILIFVVFVEQQYTSRNVLLADVYKFNKQPTMMSMLCFKMLEDNEKQTQWLLCELIY